jgi:hypothetical protein
MGKRLADRDALPWEVKEAEREARLRRIGYPALACYDNLSSDHRAKIDAYHRFALRSPKDWYRQIKRRSADERFLDLVRFTFARYPVPAHLEKVWLKDVEDDFVDDALSCARRTQSWRWGRACRGCPDLIRWYIIVAQGGSLHKEATHRYLSSLETHHFLNAPSRIGSFQMALWYAVARACNAAPVIATRIAHTKLIDFSIASTFWKEVARFFARNPIPFAEMNDLIDFLAAAKQADRDFSLKNRAVPALRRRMEDWHRSLRVERLPPLRPAHACLPYLPAAPLPDKWPGLAIPDAEYENGEDGYRTIWRFQQIKTRGELFLEGKQLHHCVASYQAACASGSASIWSMTCENPPDNPVKCLTIEVRSDGRIAQCRGFANRQPHVREMVVVQRWAREYGFKCP